MNENDIRTLAAHQVMSLSAIDGDELSLRVLPGPYIGRLAVPGNELTLLVQHTTNGRLFTGLLQK